MTWWQWTVFSWYCWWCRTCVASTSLAGVVRDPGFKLSKSSNIPLEILISVLPYLLFRLPELLVQLGQAGFEIINASKCTNPLLLQVTQLQTPCTASTGVLMLQRENRRGQAFKSESDVQERQKDSGTHLFIKSQIFYQSVRQNCDMVICLHTSIDDSILWF